jgi:hypothetical protein
MRNEYENGGNPPNPESPIAPKRRRGGQEGNTNALCHGRYSAAGIARRKRAAALMRAVRVTLASLDRRQP